MSDRTESVVLIAHSGQHDRQMLRQFYQELQAQHPVAAPETSAQPATPRPNDSGGDKKSNAVPCLRRARRRAAAPQRS